MIEAAKAHIEAQLAEARRLEAELPALNERLGAARLAQEHLQRPSTALVDWVERVRNRLRVR